jgi:hypothetical protein
MRAMVHPPPLSTEALAQRDAVGAARADFASLSAAPSLPLIASPGAHLAVADFAAV